MRSTPGSTARTSRGCTRRGCTTRTSDPPRASGYDHMMGLLELWNQNRRQIEDKRLHQLIAFAGDGRLLDGGPTAVELRQLLATAPSERLARWKDEALDDRYDGFG